MPDEVAEESASGAYFARMRETSAAAHPLLRSWLLGLAPEGADASGLRDALLLYLDRFRSHPDGTPKAWARPNLARLLFEGSSTEHWTTALPAFALTELFNVSLHQSNLAFDDKLPRDPPRGGAHTQLLASFLTLGEVSRRVQECFAPEHRDAALEILASCNRAVYQGQYLDGEVLRIDRTAEFTEEQLRALYLRRCEWMGGGTYEICAWGALAGGASEEAVTVSRAFLRWYGTAAQVLNDIRDLSAYLEVPPRVPPDVLGGKLTLPIYTLRLATGQGLSLGSGKADSVESLREAVARGAHITLTAELISRSIWPALRYHWRKLRALMKNPDAYNFVSPFVFGSTKRWRHGTGPPRTIQ